MITRAKIPKRIRALVWELHFGKVYFAKCAVSWCPTKITIMSHHLGHIQSLARGGRDSIDNLIPICADCNHSMGPLDLYEFTKLYEPARAKSWVRKMLDLMTCGCVTWTS